MLCHVSWVLINIKFNFLIHINKGPKAIRNFSCLLQLVASSNDYQYMPVHGMTEMVTTDLLTLVCYDGFRAKKKFKKRTSSNEQCSKQSSKGCSNKVWFGKRLILETVHCSREFEDQPVSSISDAWTNRISILSTHLCADN